MEEHSLVSGQEVMELIYALRCKCNSKDETIRGCTDLSPVEYRVINSITPEDTITAAQFAEKVDLSPSRASRVIDKMEKNGYIVVHRNKGDKRSILISLSEKAAEIKVDLAKQAVLCHEKIESVLTVEERTLLKQSVEKLMNSAL